jgi:hypothetical protein
MAWTEPPKDAVTNPGQFSVAYRDEDGEGRLCVPTKETEEAARTLAKDLLSQGIIAHVYSPEGTKIG